jgi:hypothetical protein
MQSERDGESEDDLDDNDATKTRAVAREDSVQESPVLIIQSHASAATKTDNVAKQSPALILRSPPKLLSRTVESRAEVRVPSKPAKTELKFRVVRLNQFESAPMSLASFSVSCLVYT